MFLSPDILVGKVVEAALSKGHSGRILVGYLAFLWNDTGLWPPYYVLKIMFFN